MIKDAWRQISQHILLKWLDKNSSSTPFFFVLLGNRIDRLKQTNEEEKPKYKQSDCVGRVLQLLFSYHNALSNDFDLDRRVYRQIIGCSHSCSVLSCANKFGARSLYLFIIRRVTEPWSHWLDNCFGRNIFVLKQAFHCCIVNVCLTFASFTSAGLIVVNTKL